MRYKNLVRYNKLKDCDCEHSYEDKMFMDYMERGGKINSNSYQEGGEEERSWLDSTLDFADEYIRKPIRDGIYDVADVGLAWGANVGSIPRYVMGEEEPPVPYRVNRNSDGSINTDDMVVEDNRDFNEIGRDIKEKTVRAVASEIAGGGVGHGLGYVAKGLKKPVKKLIDKIRKGEKVEPKLNFELPSTSAGNRKILPIKVNKVLGKLEHVIANRKNQNLYNTSNTVNELNPKWAKGAKKKTGKEFMENWYNPENKDLIQRYQNYGYSEDDAVYEIIKARNKLSQYTFKDYDDLEKFVETYKDDPENYEHLRDALNDSMGLALFNAPEHIYTKRVKSLLGKQRKKEINLTEGHELSHLVDESGELLTEEMQEDLLNAVGTTKKRRDRVNLDFNKKWAYYTKPTEIKARMVEIRHALGLEPSDKFTEAHFDKAMKMYDGFQGIHKNTNGVNKKAMIKAMNKLPAVTGVAAGAGALAKSQQEGFKDGGEFYNYMKKFQEGGEEASNVTPQERQLLDYIGQFESSGGDYNRLYGGYKGGTSKPLTEMTVNEVLALQDIMKSSGSSAVGAHQFIQESLKEELKKANIDGNTLFTPKLQDTLILNRLKRSRGLDDFLSGDLSTKGFAKKLSKEFASMPNPETGISYYDGDGLNKSLTSVEDVSYNLNNILGNKTSLDKKYPNISKKDLQKINKVLGSDPNYIRRMYEVTQSAPDRGVIPNSMRPTEKVGTEDMSNQDQIKEDNARQRLLIKQQERNFLNDLSDMSIERVKQVEDKSQYQQQIQPTNPIQYQPNNVDITISQPSMQEGGENMPINDSDLNEGSERTDMLRSIPRESFNLIRNYRADKANPQLAQRFKNINNLSGNSCLGGALNCGTQSEEHPAFGFMAENLPGVPSLRSIMESKDQSKYKTNDVKPKDIGNWVKNSSIDAWEVHNYLRGEGLGYNPFEDVKEWTYNKNSRVPDQILDNLKRLPIGTIIGQGDVNVKGTGNDGRGYRGYAKQNPNNKNRNRHGFVIMGYDEKDGMPITYDSGEERRLDDPKYGGVSSSGVGKVNNVTVPNEYKNLTYQNLLDAKKLDTNRLGYSFDDSGKNYTSLKSTWKPIKAIEKGFNQHSQKISQMYNLPKSTMDKFAKLLPGLSKSETKLNNNDGYSFDGFLPTSFVDSVVGNKLIKPTGKALDNFFGEIGQGISDAYEYFVEEDETEDVKGADWELEIKAHKKFPNDKEKEDAYYKELAAKRKTRFSTSDSGFGDGDSESSVGAFKIKDLSRYANKIGLKKGDLYGHNSSNSEELERGSVAAVSLLAEKFNEAKKKWNEEGGKNLSEDQLVKLAIIGYSNNKKMNSEKFVDNYILGDLQDRDSKYNKIVNYDYNGEKAKALSISQPSMQEGGFNY